MQMGQVRGSRLGLTGEDSGTELALEDDPAALTLFERGESELVRSMVVLFAFSEGMSRGLSEASFRESGVLVHYVNSLSS